MATNWSDIFAPLIGRILMGGYFLLSGIIGVLNFPAAVESIGLTGVGLPVEVTMLALTIEILGGLSLIVGYASQFSSLGLVIFVVASTFINSLTPDPVSTNYFLHNMAVIGGLLYISAYGAGAWSPLWHYRSYK